VAARDGEEALETALSATPSLVVLDIDLPGISGYEVCRELRDRHGDGLPILFVSGTRTEQLDRVSGLLLGADDYLVKPFEADEFLARVRRHLSRSQAPEKANGALSLTAREQEILGLLASGLDQRAIAEQLVISPKTVATHIQRILGKLGVRSRAQAVAFAHQHGLVAPA
jgi:DNA-binding NarL/FixJ family response regulator